jgi:hypothetical protein
MTMPFRKFGRLDWDASVLGFGCMRLPTVDGNPHGPNINEAEAARMIRHALDRGVNYFDTAYIYHEGNSETVLGKALRGHRDLVKIATKSPVWLINKEADFDRILNEQLRRLQTDHIDLMALGPARSDGGVERHEQHGPDGSQPGFGVARSQPFISGGGPETDRGVAAKVPGTSRYSLHQLQLLHALPKRSEHPGQF